VPPFEVLGCCEAVFPKAAVEGPVQHIRQWLSELRTKWTVAQPHWRLTYRSRIVVTRSGRRCTVEWRS
jgi:hypothetical protein